MYQKIVVAYNESAESHRALVSGIQLAKNLGAELETITVMAELPAYTSFAAAADPALPRVLNDDRLRFYESLQAKVQRLAQEQNISVVTHVVEGSHIESIVRFLREHRSDLLVVGLHPRDLYIARLWSTVYELAQEAPCSVLGVH